MVGLGQREVCKEFKRCKFDFANVYIAGPKDCAICTKLHDGTCPESIRLADAIDQIGESLKPFKEKK